MTIAVTKCVCSGIGSVVLFHQGGYCASSEVGRLAGVRWHQGKITEITVGVDGEKMYSGAHTKSKKLLQMFCIAFGNKTVLSVGLIVHYIADQGLSVTLTIGLCLVSKPHMSIFHQCVEHATHTHKH